MLDHFTRVEAVATTLVAIATVLKGCYPWKEPLSCRPSHAPDLLVDTTVLILPAYALMESKVKIMHSWEMIAVEETMANTSVSRRNPSNFEFNNWAWLEN